MNNTSKWIVGIIVILLVVWGGYSYFQNPTSDESIKIGVIGPLVGEMSNWGEPMKDGIELAIKEWNDAGGISGRKIEGIFEDNKDCDISATVSAFNKLINTDKAKAVIVGCSGATLAAAPIAEKNKIILLTTLSSAAKISDAGDYIFRTCISDAVQGKNLGEYIADELKIGKVGVIYVNNDYGVGFFDNFNSAFVSKGGEILNSEKYEPNVIDFRTSLTKIKEKKPEAMVIISYGKEGGLITKQAREMGITVRFVGSDNFGVKEVVEAGGNSTEGAIFITSALDDKSEKIKEFKSNLVNVFGREPQIMIAAANSYDGTQLLLRAIKSKGYNPDGIKDFLYSVKNYNGVSGLITIDKRGDSNMPSTIQEIKNGQFVPYENN